MSYYLFQLKILILFAIHTTYHYPLIFFSRFKYLQLIRKLYSNLLFFPLLLLDQVPFKMLPAIREITCIKYIILESNRKCAKGLILNFILFIVAQNYISAVLYQPFKLADWFQRRRLLNNFPRSYVKTTMYVRWRWPFWTDIGVTEHNFGSWPSMTCLLYQSSSFCCHVFCLLHTFNRVLLFVVMSSVCYTPLTEFLFLLSCLLFVTHL